MQLPSTYPGDPFFLALLRIVVCTFPMVCHAVKTSMKARPNKITFNILVRDSSILNTIFHPAHNPPMLLFVSIQEYNLHSCQLNLLIRNTNNQLDYHTLLLKTFKARYQWYGQLLSKVGGAHKNRCFNKGNFPADKNSYDFSERICAEINLSQLSNGSSTK